MPNSDPPGGFFFPTLTLMMDSYNVLHSSSFFIIQDSTYYLQAEWKTVDPDQLASDLDLHCFQNRIYLGSAWERYTSEQRIKNKSIW